MAITTLPTPPSRSQSQSVFNTNMEAFFAALPQFTSDTNATQAAMTMIAAGTAFAIPYTFDTTITDADPGAGKLRLSSATQNAATVIRAELVGSDAQNYAAVLADFVSSTNTVKGQIRLVKLGDATKWLTFNLTAMASPTGYKNITVTPIGGSSAAPFVNGDSLVLLFTRAGDLGATSLILHVREQQTSGTNGGTSVSADKTQTRVINTTVINTIPGASLAGNTVTLPAGTYKFFGRAPSYQSGRSVANLFGTTDSNPTLIGSGAISSNTSCDSIIVGVFTIAASKSFTIRHYTQTGVAALGLGFAASVPSQVEIYTEAFFEKIG